MPKSDCYVIFPYIEQIASNGKYPDAQSEWHFVTGTFSKLNVGFYEANCD